MKKFSTISRISILLPFLINYSNIVRGDAPDSPEHDVEAMEAIIADFCRIKKLCKGNRHGNFVVFLYEESKTESLLSEAEKQAITTCEKKYEIRMTIQSVESLYIYCYDNKQPKILIEREIAQNIELR